MDMSLSETEIKLAEKAVLAREKAYAPYSNFKVGAALLTADGKVYLGCNIENAAYGPSNCAERTAFFKAVSEGERDFTAIAITGRRDGDKRGMAYPCGICRQVMREFTDPSKFRIIVTDGAERLEAYTLEELLPRSFGPESL